MSIRVRILWLQATDFDSNLSESRSLVEGHGVTQNQDKAEHLGLGKIGTGSF